MKQLWQMKYVEFERTIKPTRNWMEYSAETRSNLAASFRLGHRQRQAVGEYYYTVPNRPGVCFETAKRAKVAAHMEVIRQALEDGLSVPEEVLAEYPTFFNRSK